ncbi:MAG: DUF4476 domain-containing protein [Bacteroidetes bacterium]|nr:DUF4476 domain-containing protein [Bacteroidota bacterium]MBS1931144.1 DUF4476 domain-containing protein [Bacteroidota bacterium]
MKTISTLLVFFFLSISVFATDNRPSGSLFVKSNNRGDVKVVMDGRYFLSEDNTLLIRDVRSGMHNVKVYRQKNTGFFSDMIKKYELVYADNLFVKPGRLISITIDRFGQSDIEERKIKGNRMRNQDDDDHYFDRDYHDGDRDDRYNRNDDYDNDRYSRAMNDKDFDFVLQSINKEWYENNKVVSARQIINTNYFTSSQVKQMLQLFSYDNNKLDLAKLAYGKTVDQRNYQCVFDELSFSSSKAALSQYIQNFR